MTLQSPSAFPSDADPILAGAPHRIGRVSLTVHDLAGVGRFYTEALGLDRIEETAERTTLGTDGRVLLDLRRDPAARKRSPREAGLFHTAFLLPSRADLGAWIAHAGRSGLRLQGAADHLVSEAVYLADPEGNGIEVYADRPSAVWPRAGGQIEMDNAPLDAEGLITEGAARPWGGFPEGGTVGHVHLQVGALEAAEAFYGALLGFDVTCRYPGGTFFGSGGYHHQLAANVWNSRGAGPRAFPSTGLAEVEILTHPDAIERVRARLPAGTEAAEEAGRLTLRDPWGTAIALVASAR